MNRKVFIGMWFKVLTLRRALSRKLSQERFLYTERDRIISGRPSNLNRSAANSALQYERSASLIVICAKPRVNIVSC